DTWCRDDRCTSIVGIERHRFLRNGSREVGPGTGMGSRGSPDVCDTPHSWAACFCLISQDSCYRGFTAWGAGVADGGLKGTSGHSILREIRNPFATYLNRPSESGSMKVKPALVMRLTAIGSGGGAPGTKKPGVTGKSGNGGKESRPMYSRIISRCSSSSY